MERIGIATDLVVASLATRSNSRGGRPNEIVPIADAKRLPPLQSEDVDRIGRFVVWTDTAGQVTLARPLSDTSRLALERRAHELQCAVAPYSDEHRDEVLGAISGMLGGFPSMQRYDQVAALGMAAAYAWTVRERPPWAIQHGCNLIRSGEAGLNRAYCPTEPEFNQLAKRVAAPYVEALRRSRQLLKADVLPEPRPKPSREEIEAKLGRTLAKPPPDPCYAARAFSDLEARKVRREGCVPPDDFQETLPPSVPL
jgi:hypothetical protein